MDDGFDRENILHLCEKKSFGRDFAAGIEGGDVIGDFPPRLQRKNPLPGVEGGHGVGDEFRPAVFGQFADMEADFLGAIDPGEHSRGHAGIILVGGGADKGNLVAASDILLQPHERGKVGMATADKD
jgi:hypothetical protein